MAYEQLYLRARHIGDRLLNLRHRDFFSPTRPDGLVRSHLRHGAPSEAP